MSYYPPLPMYQYGEYVVHDDHVAVDVKEHHCWKPGGVYGTDANFTLNKLPLPNIGDVWMCDCGQYWQFGHPWGYTTIAWDPISEHKALKIAKKAKTS